MKSAGAAPCQCNSPGGVQTVSSWCITITLSAVTTRPTPSVTRRVCPQAWLCQAVRAPGVKRTVLARIRDGSSPRTISARRFSRMPWPGVRAGLRRAADDGFLKLHLFVVTGEGRIKAVLTGARPCGKGSDALCHLRSLLYSQLGGANIELLFSLVEFHFARVNGCVPAIRGGVARVCGRVSEIGEELALVSSPLSVLIGCSSCHRVATSRDDIATPGIGNHNYSSLAGSIRRGLIAEMGPAQAYTPDGASAASSPPGLEPPPQWPRHTGRGLSGIESPRTRTTTSMTKVHHGLTKVTLGIP